MFLDQRAENNVHAGEEVVVVDDPSATSSTSVDNEAAKDARTEPEQDESIISPYACAPVVIDCGPGLATYCVPKHLLRSPKWLTTDAGGILHLEGVSAATGHTLVHYLYTGTYQPLEVKSGDAASMAHMKFKQALLTFALATVYELPDLEGLAKEQIRTHGGFMALDEILDTARKCTWFPKMAWSWFHEYLQARAKEQFKIDYKYFTSKVYIDSVGDGKLHRFMTCHLLETFTEKLTYVLQNWEGHCVNKERADALFDGVEDTAGQTHCFSRCHSRHPTGSRIESRKLSSEPAPELEPALAPEPEKEYDPWSSSFSSTDKNKKKKKKGAVEEPLPELEPVIKSVPEPVPEPKPVKEEDPWGFAVTTGKRLKKKKAQDEPKNEEPQPPEPESEAMLEPSPPHPEEEPEPVEELAIDPFAGISKMQKKKLQRKMEKEAWLKEEEDAERKEKEAAKIFRQLDEDEVEPERIRLEEDGVAERHRLEEEEAATSAAAAAVAAAVAEAKKKKEEPWGVWGAVITTGKKKKKKKKGAKEELRVEEPPSPPPEPEPLIELEPSPLAEEKANDGWGDWSATAAPVNKSKQKKGVTAMIPEPLLEEPVPEPGLVNIPGPIAESEPVEEKDDGGDWGLGSIWGVGNKKKKKKGKIAQPENPILPPEPLVIETAVQEPFAVEEAEAEAKGGWDRYPWGKKKNDPKKGALVGQEEKRAEDLAVEEEEKRMQGSILEISSVLCPRRSHHLSEGDGWRSCERCRAMIRVFAAQLEK